MRRRATGVLVLAAALLGPPGGALQAQQAGPAPAPGLAGRGTLPRPRAGMPVAELEQLFDSLEVVEARKALALGDAEFVSFAERLQALQRLRMRHRARRLVLLRDLRELDATQTPAQEETARTTLAALDALEAEQTRELRQARAGIDEVLTLAQRVQFRLFLERFERQKLNLLSQARGRGGRGAP
jgi:hypothetical protein